MAAKEKLLAQFRDLVVERAGKISRALMTLETGPDVEAGKHTLRELHSLKGEARMMGYGDINSLVHEMEELVRASAGRDYALQAASVDAMLVVCDAVQVLAGSTQGEAPDLPKLLGWLQQCLRVETGGPAEVAAPAPVPVAPPRSSPAQPPARAESSAPAAAVQSVVTRISQQSLEKLTAATTALQQHARQNEALAARRRQFQRDLTAMVREVEDAGPAFQTFAARLTLLKETASDIHRRATLAWTDEQKELAVLAEEVSALRMVPLSLLFEPYPRMVRELSKELGKDVDVVIEGENERIDRTVLEALKEPLLHLVRNAIDHGFETRAARVAARKSPRGVLLLTARTEGDHLVLRVSDDGAGLAPAQLREVAVRRGELDEAAARQLSDAQVIDLIFASGFTSREAVTDLSGRGVGLDVVRTKLVSVGGEVTVDSTQGEGATFEVRVPISLAVAPVLFIKAGDETLCLQAANVVSALLVESGQYTEVASKPALRVGDEVLPFSTLGALLFGAGERPPATGELVLVLRGRGHQAALAVDRVLEERVQAILPLKGLLTRYTYLSGATVLTDGGLALVLSAAHLVATVHGRELKLGATLARPTGERRQRVLVVDDSPLTRELLVSLLEAVGYQIAQATDGADALRVLEREPVDLVVTDLEMPDVDGLELTRRLKAHPSLKALPVVIVTTRGSEADRRRGMEAGADGYVTKGDLVRQDLVDVVGRLLS